MSLTFNQLYKNKRLIKKVLNKTPALEKCPQKKGMCLKLVVRTPKKPNSALRKLAKLKLSNKKVLYAYIPGEGHKCAVVLVFPLSILVKFMWIRSFVNKVTSLPEVAEIKSSGKASGDVRLRSNESMSRLSETIDNMVTIRNLIRLAGMSWSWLVTS